MQPFPWPARLYLWGVALAGGVALALWLWGWRAPAAAGSSDLALFLFLVAVAAVAQHGALPLGRGRKVDVAPGVYFAGLLHFGAAGGVALAGAAHTLGQATLALRRNPQTGLPRGSVRGLLFNTGQMLLATALGGLVYYAALPHQAPAPLDRPANLWALPAAAGAMYLANSLAVAVMIGLHTGRPPAAIWRTGRRFDVLQFAALYMAGVAIAAAARSPWGAAAPIVLVLPLAAVHLALRQAVRLVADERAARDEAARVAAAEARTRGEFFRVASHELRTPLTSLRGYTQLLLEQLEGQGAPGPERAHHALRVIDQEAERLTRVAVQLQDAARLHEGELRLERHPVDLAALVAGVVAAARPGTRHPLLLRAREPVWADVDASRLERVVWSLLDVILRYALAGDPVEVAVYRTPTEAAALAVGGPSAALPAEYRNHLADRFTRAAREHRPGGLGLGLYVSRHIVEGHGGTIAVETPPEGGTRFVVTLPGREAPGDPADPPPVP